MIETIVALLLIALFKGAEQLDRAYRFSGDRIPRARALHAPEIPTFARPGRDEFGAFLRAYDEYLNGKRAYEDLPAL